MDANAQYELYLIKNELQSIIDELYSIAGGVRTGFEGIGNEKCANSITKAANHYEEVRTKLNNMNLSAVTEEFVARKRAEAEAQARAQAEARARAEAEARAKAEAEAKAAKSGSKSTSSDSNKKKSNNVLEDLFGWLFK